MTNLVHARYEIGQFCTEVVYLPAGKQQLFSLFFGVFIIDKVRTQDYNYTTLYNNDININHQRRLYFN